MLRHRNPRPKVSDTDSLDNNARDFDAGSALEDLHADVVRLEALADAATRALEFMPRASTPEQRRANARIYALMTILADEIVATLAMGDRLVARLGEHMALRRTGKAVRP